MIFGFLFAICFDPHLWTAATQPRWALLAITLPILTGFSAPNHCDLTKLLGLLFIAWAALSLTWTANFWDGSGELIQLLIIAQAFVYGSRLSSLKPIFMGLALGITVSSAIITIPALQGLFVNSVVQVYPHGLWGNRNMMGEIAVLTLLGLLVYFPGWSAGASTRELKPLGVIAHVALMLGVLPAIFYYKPEIMSGTPSRGALLALVAGIGTWLWSRSRWQACLFGGVVFLAGAALVSVDHTHGNAGLERLQVWQAVLGGVDLAGRGIGSLYTIAPYLSGIWDTTERRIDHAHNELIECLFSYGLIGATLYLAIIALALGSACHRTRVVLVAFLVISMVAFPWHIPGNALVGALVMGHAVRGRRNLRDEYDAWRVLLRKVYGACRAYYTGGHRDGAISGQVQPV